MKRIIVAALFFGLMVTASASFAKSFVKLFTPNSYMEILKEYEGKEFTLIFWSVLCSPCLKGLSAISENKMYANHVFVFVSTDYDLSIEDVALVIEKFKLQNQAQWKFQPSEFQAILNSVDPYWHGEVPRNYFFDEEHNRSRFRKIK